MTQEDGIRETIQFGFDLAVRYAEMAQKYDIDILTFLKEVQAERKAEGIEQ